MMHLIFDFDGTLVDSFDCVIEQFNQLSEHYKFTPINLAHKNELSHLNSKQLMALFHIPFYKMPAILFKARKSLHQHMTSLAPFKDIPETIEQLVKKGFILGIVTSNSEENVVSWLKHHQLYDYFDFIHAGSTYYGKRRALKKAMKLNKIEHAMYIGDETRDIDAAKYANMFSMAVTWGFNSQETLSRHQPHAIAQTPKDIIKISVKYSK
jgi:phosphoglycolate phosphatase